VEVIRFCNTLGERACASTGTSVLLLYIWWHRYRSALLQEGGDERLGVLRNVSPRGAAHPRLVGEDRPPATSQPICVVSAWDSPSGGLKKTHAASSRQPTPLAVGPSKLLMAKGALPQHAATLGRCARMASQSCTLSFQHRPELPLHLHHAWGLALPTSDNGGAEGLPGVFLEACKGRQYHAKGMFPRTLDLCHRWAAAKQIVFELCYNKCDRLSTVM